MKLNEKYHFGLRGHVKAFWKRDHGLELAHDTKNIITYRSADMLARMLGGDLKYRPTFVGYLYGPASPGSPMPNPSSTREHTMATIASELLALGGNMIVSPLSANPSFTVDGDPAIYEGNQANLSAISDGSSDLVYSSTLGYASLPPQAGSDKYYQVVLLARYYEPGSVDPIFVPFARTQLASGTDGLDVQSGSELVVFWDITFN